MEDFVSNADALLAALLDREELPNDGMCQLCPNKDQARWRCKDCTFPLILCRSCMRHSHQINPLHRIECWTGTFFRAANLWEVGAYLLVLHHKDKPLCETLVNQKKMLEVFAVAKDQDEQRALSTEPGFMAAAAAPTTGTDAAFSFDDEDLDEDFDDASHNNAYGNNAGVNNMPADQLLVPNDLPIPNDLPVPNDLPKSNALPERSVPRHDVLRNSYTRVIHTNGIHQIPLVTCGCLGSNNIHADLVYSKLIPASFFKYRTIFTTDVLDDFRLSHLECKSSAYQYFQKLRRLTAPTAPATASNFYQELLRMSRLWRWLKKKKWAGHGHKSLRGPEPSPVLANFCAACPQPGINLPDNWQCDPAR